MGHLLVRGLAILLLWLIAELIGDGVGTFLSRAVRLLYAPPLGYFLLPVTWVAVVVVWHSFTVQGAGRAPLPVLGLLALIALGLIGVLILRDARRASRRLPPVATRVPARFGPLGRGALAIGGLCCFGVAALTWSTGGIREWQATGSGILFGSACLYAAVTARLPAWLVRVLGARQESAEASPPAG